MHREDIIMGALLLLVGALISFEIGRVLGYGEGKEAILELLSKYECLGHQPLPGGSIECTRWEKRREPALPEPKPEKKKK